MLQSMLKSAGRNQQRRLPIEKFHTCSKTNFFTKQNYCAKCNYNPRKTSLNPTNQWFCVMQANTVPCQSAVSKTLPQTAASMATCSMSMFLKIWDVLGRHLRGVVVMGSTVALKSLALQLNCDFGHFKQKKAIKQSLLESPCYITNHTVRDGMFPVCGMERGLGLGQRKRKSDYHYSII